MRIELFSKEYKVRILSNTDVDIIYELCSRNSLYYEYCPPYVTRKGILEDMKALPPGKSIHDKYYMGFFLDEELIAVMDFIDGYPEKEIAYIGFFMTDASIQQKGVGTSIIESMCKYLKNLGYGSVRLCWVKGNSQAEHFWIKNQFQPIMETKSNVADKVILAERQL